jgi:hypothetical protein
MQPALMELTHAMARDDNWSSKRASAPINIMYPNQKEPMPIRNPNKQMRNHCTT